MRMAVPRLELVVVLQRTDEENAGTRLLHHCLHPDLGQAMATWRAPVRCADEEQRVTM